MPGNIEKSSNTLKNNPDQIGMERLIFFSDAVFAIAITLLTLEIRLPATDGSLTNAELLQSILAIGPKYIAYIISFLVIGLFWIGHHRKFQLIRKYDGTLMFLNFLLLMTIAFIPFPTFLISTYGNRTATIFYACVMILASLLSVIIWWYASYMDRLTDPRMDYRQRMRENTRTSFSHGRFHSFDRVGFCQHRPCKNFMGTGRGYTASVQITNVKFIV